MNQHQELNITGFDNKSKGIQNQFNSTHIPQSTKNSGHSKIKGFSFHLDSNNQIKEDHKEKLQMLDENGKQKVHKAKISLLQNSSQIGFSNSNNNNNNQVQENTYDKNCEQGNLNEEIDKNLISNLNKGKVLDTPLNITDLIRVQNNYPIHQSNLKKEFEKYESARHSQKSLSLVKAFAANTHQGTVRKYNEDRVSIILNIVKPNTYKGTSWPSCSFFAVFDGHGGAKCADFLKDNLHNFVSFL